MRGARSLAAGLTVAVAMAGAVLVAPAPAFADGTTAVPVTCTGIPIIGSTSATANVNATDDVDPVTVGGTVVNTINVPVPVQDPPVDVTVKEVKLTIAIPTGVTVNDVTFTPSSFSSQTWTVNGSNLVVTLSGTVVIANGGAAPTVPDVKVTTTVAGPPRTVSWKVPSSIVAKGSTFLGTFTATCAADDPTAVLITTTVAAANTAPTATDQTLTTPYQTAKAITLSGTDPESNPLTFALGATAPTHGTLSGTVPNVTYTPAVGYSGPDAFTFTVSDGLLSDTGTVSITVGAPGNTAPAAPTIGGAPTAKEGQATITWTPPANDGGSALTGFVVTPYAGAVAQPAVAVAGGSATSQTITGLANGTTYTFKVAAVNAIGTGPQSAATSAVTPQWWLPWSSGSAAVNQLFTWFTGKAPTATELSSWLGQLDGGTKLPGDLVAALRVGPDATSNVDPTARLYSAYFVRIPDASGLQHWIKKKRGGTKISDISTEFAKSSEFKRRYGALSNRAFVEQIYLNVQGRAGEKTGVDFWTGQLDSKKKNRGQVMVGFSESNEYKRTQVNKLHAAVAVIDLDGKAPTVPQRDAFVASIVGGSTLAEVVRNLIHTDATFAARAG